MKDEKARKILMSLMIILKNYPQCQCFAEVDACVTRSFHGAIKDLLEELTDASS